MKKRSFFIIYTLPKSPIHLSYIVADALEKSFREEIVFWPKLLLVILCLLIWNHNGWPLCPLVSCSVIGGLETFSLLIDWSSSQVRDICNPTTGTSLARGRSGADSSKFWVFAELENLYYLEEINDISFNARLLADIWKLICNSECLCTKCNKAQEQR